MVIMLIIDTNNNTEEKRKALIKLKETWNMDINGVWLILVLLSFIIVPLSLLMKTIKLIRFLTIKIDKEDKE
jgi:NADH:ubiquinone oxidoreductase subunit 4 (subunit M)